MGLPNGIKFFEQERTEETEMEYFFVSSAASCSNLYLLFSLRLRAFA
jgi:hypothetical protein